MRRTGTRRRDPDATRASIRRAAEHQFVAHGFAGTSMSDIARRAKVTKSLIHHHFGSKEDLWNEVKKNRLGQYAEAQLRLMQEGAGGEPAVRESIEIFFNFLRENPGFVRLVTWMNLEDPKLSAPQHPDLLESSLRKIEEEQRAGRLRDDIDPGNLMVCLISLCTYWFTAKSAGLANLVGGRAAEVDGIDDRQLEAIQKVFFEGVLPRNTRG